MRILLIALAILVIFDHIALDGSIRCAVAREMQYRCNAFVDGTYRWLSDMVRF